MDEETFSTRRIVDVLSSAPCGEVPSFGNLGGVLTAAGQLVAAADRSHNRSTQKSCGVIMKEFAGARKTLEDRFNE